MVGPIDPFNINRYITHNTQSDGTNSSAVNNSNSSSTTDSRRIIKDISRAPLSLADDLNKLLSKLELTKTGSFSGTDDALVFKVNYPYLQENGFLKVQNDLLEINKTILGDYSLNERVLNYKIESFPTEQFPTRNKIQFKPSHDFQYGSEIVNIPNIYDDLTEKSVFPDYEARLLVPVLVGPPSLADLKTNSGLTNNLVKGISKSALEILEKVANKEGERKVDFHAAHALDPVMLPNTKWAIINDSFLLDKFGFPTDNLKIGLDPEYILSSKNLVELALKANKPYNQPPVTPPVLDDLFQKLDIKITHNNPRIEFKTMEDNQIRYTVANPRFSSMPGSAIDHRDAAGLNYYLKERVTRPILSPTPSVPHIVDPEKLPVLAAAFLHDQNGNTIFPSTLATASPKYRQ